MITNLCPYDGNEEWCPPIGGTNEYGYSYHFDIMAESEVFGDNPVVDFEQVACPSAAVSDYAQCQVISESLFPLPDCCGTCKTRMTPHTCLATPESSLAPLILAENDNANS